MLITIISMKSKSALLIGILYKGTKYELKGCHNDVDNYNSFIKKRGYNDITVLKDTSTLKSKSNSKFKVGQPTKDKIIEGFNHLLNQARNKGVREFIIQFSGHGIKHTVRPISGTRTSNGYDTALIPSDFEKEGVVTQSLISAYLYKFPEGCRVLLIFDCCHSGTMTNLPYMLIHSTRFEKLNSLDFKANLLCIAGCTRDGKSVDVYNLNRDKSWSGALSWAILESLKIGEKITVTKILGNIRKLMIKYGYNQVPQITATWKFSPKEILAFDKKSLFFRNENIKNLNTTELINRLVAPKTVKELRAWRKEKRRIEKTGKLKLVKDKKTK